MAHVACSRKCLERAIHESKATRATLQRTRSAVRAALANYYRADRKLATALRRVHGVPHPKPINMKRFAASELDELKKLEHELRELRPFVPKQLKAKRRKARR